MTRTPELQDVSYDAQPRLLIVLVTHNGQAWLADCLHCLRSQLYPRIDLVIVDNGSDEQVTSIVGRYAPQAELVRSERNLGFGAACNAALEASSRTSGAEYFLFMHDDVCLEPEACSMLIVSALETGAGVVGGKGFDWTHQEALVEVGMTADQFCAPYSGLEQGEIDQGQYEKRKETLYVSNACLLVSRELVARCGLWDGAYFALGEDLDLCIRAQVAGFKVIVAPQVRYRHAEALVNGLRRTTGLPSLGVMARSNQLRTIAKNASLPWMLFSLTGCVLLGAIRMIALVAVRRFKEVPDYPKALVDFLRTLPDIKVRRKAVQKRRKVPDRKVRGLMVKDSHRFRVQLERRLRQWEQGTVALGARTLSQLSLPELRRRLNLFLSQPSTISIGVVVLVLIIAMRQLVFGPAIASGSLWPFPGSSVRLLSDYVAGWRNTGLGTEAAAPPAYPIMWLVSVLGLGSALLSQKLLVVLLVGCGLFGIFRLVKASTATRPALILALCIYSLGPVVQAMVSGADLGALAMFAGAPYLLGIVLSMLPPGPARPESPSARPQLAAGADVLIAGAARMALIGLAVVALGPSNFVSITFLLLSAAGYYALSLAGTANPWTRVRWVLLAIPLLALVLMPWSLEGLRPSGPILGPLFSGTGGSYYPLWQEWTTAGMLLLTPRGGLGALVVGAIIIGVLTLASPARRAESRMLAVLLLGFGIVGGLVAHGVLAPPAASPAMWLTIPLGMVALMAGHLVAGIQEELPKHAFGWRHKFAIPLVSLVVGAGFLIGWVPQLVSWDRPAATFAGGTGEFSSSIASFLKSTAQEVGDFRVLWLGTRWADPIRSGLPSRSGTDYFLTGADGLTMLDGVYPPPAQGELRLDGLIAALMGNRLHLAGHLMGPANVRFVIVDTEDRRTMRAMSRQRDIALEQQQSGVAIFRNLQWLPRASLPPGSMTEAITAPRHSDAALMLTDWSGGRSIPSRSRSTFSIGLPRTLHSQVLLGDNHNKAWKATLGGERLKHFQAVGWANRFDLPEGARGELKITFGGNWVRLLWLAVQVVVLLAVITMARTVSAPARLKAV
ncbi:MAG: glycosyltransferase family 2 protein [Actinomycetota bacterium]